MFGAELWNLNARLGILEYPNDLFFHVPFSRHGPSCRGHSVQKNFLAHGLVFEGAVNTHL